MSNGMLDDLMLRMNDLSDSCLLCRLWTLRLAIIGYLVVEVSDDRLGSR